MILRPPLVFVLGVAILSTRLENPTPLRASGVSERKHYGRDVVGDCASAFPPRAPDRVHSCEACRDVGPRIRWDAIPANSLVKVHL